MPKMSKQKVDELIKLVFDAGAIVSQVDNVLPNEGLDEAEKKIDKVLQGLVDTVRGDESRFEYLERLVRK